MNLPKGRGTRVHINAYVTIAEGSGMSLKSSGIIKKSFFTVNGTIRIKLQQDGPYDSITHLDDVRDRSQKKVWMFNI